MNKIWRIQWKIKCFFSHIYNIFFLKLEDFEADKIIELIKRHQKECHFTSDFTIWKIEKYLTKKK